MYQKPKLVLSESENKRANVGVNGKDLLDINCSYTGGFTDATAHKNGAKQKLCTFDWPGYNN